MSRVVVSLVPKLCLSLSGNSVHQTPSCGTVGLSPLTPSPMDLTLGRDFCSNLFAAFAFVFRFCIVWPWIGPAGT